MALEPKIKVCLEDSCGKLKVTDVTGTYDANDNTGGWGSPNISGSDVDLAELQVTFPDGTDKTYDLTSEVPSSVSGDFTYNKIERDWPDGKYCFTYRIKSDQAETLPKIEANYEDTSITDGDKYTFHVDTTGDGSVDTEIGSYTAGSNENTDDLYNNLATDIDNNSNFSASNDDSNNDFTVTAPAGTGSTYNSRSAELQKNGSTDTTYKFNSSGEDAVDLDTTYTICPCFFCHVRCCVHKMRAKVQDELCNCDHEPFIEDTNLAFGLLRGLEAACACNDTSRQSDMLDRLKRLCNFNDCNC